MEEKILIELQELRYLLARIVGTAGQAVDQQFSEDALNKAAKAYTEMAIQRGHWITDDELPKYLGSCPWEPGRFIREAFDFSNVIKKGRSYFYFKEDVIALGHELKARNIDLKRYKEFLEDKAHFDKKVAEMNNLHEPKSKGKQYKILVGLKNITTTEIPKPDPLLVRQDLANLKAEFKKEKYNEYIDIYKGTHSMLKFAYHFEKYLEPGLKNRCRKWCEHFNYANHALQLITGKKEKFSEGERATIEL